MPTAEEIAAAPKIRLLQGQLRLNAGDFRLLFEQLGPSLGLWRAAEIAVFREQHYEHPVLDLGCGDGIVTSFVLGSVEIGLDPDEAALRKAASRAVYRELIARRAELAPVPDGAISTVISNSVIEHIPNIGSVLLAVRRMLRPGGRFIFTVPTAAFSRWLTFPMDSYARWRNAKLAHLNLWSASVWQKQLQDAGLTLECVRPYLRRSLVFSWDFLELLQQIWIGRVRLFSLMWKKLPGSVLDRLAAQASRLDLSAPLPGGGCLFVARKLRS